MRTTGDMRTTLEARVTCWDLSAAGQRLSVSAAGFSIAQVWVRTGGGISFCMAAVPVATAQRHSFQALPWLPEAGVFPEGSEPMAHTARSDLQADGQ
jgi:hypothetical protein